MTCGFVHGDLIPGSLLIDGDRLSGIIDWDRAGRGDVAQDLAPAISLDEGDRWILLGTVTAHLPDGTSVDEHVYAAPVSS